MASLENGFFHVNNRQRLSISQRNFERAHRNIASGPEELHSGQRSSHLAAGKAGSRSRPFTGIKNHAADAATRPIRMYEERTDLGRVLMWVEQRVFASRPLVGSVKGLALAPAATTSDDHP